MQGNINIKIPPNVSSGQSLRLKGLGLPSDNGFGVLNVKIKIIIPKNYSNEIKKIFLGGNFMKVYEIKFCSQDKVNEAFIVAAENMNDALIALAMRHPIENLGIPTIVEIK